MDIPVWEFWRGDGLLDSPPTPTSPPPPPLSYPHFLAFCAFLELRKVSLVIVIDVCERPLLSLRIPEVVAISYVGRRTREHAFFLNAICGRVRCFVVMATASAKHAVVIATAGLASRRIVAVRKKTTEKYGDTNTNNNNNTNNEIREEVGKMSTRFCGEEKYIFSGTYETLMLLENIWILMKFIWFARESECESKEMKVEE